MAQRNSNNSYSALPAKLRFQTRIIKLKSPLNPNYNVNPITDLRFQMLKTELTPLLITGLCHCLIKLLILSLWMPRALATVSLQVCCLGLLCDDISSQTLDHDKQFLIDMSSGLSILRLQGEEKGK